MKNLLKKTLYEQAYQRKVDMMAPNQDKKALYEQAYQLKVDMLLMEGRKENAFKKYAALGEDILETLADEDEDNNYKHLNWMAKQLIKIPDWEAYSKYGKEQEAELIINGLNKFLEYRPRLKRKDINQYKNIEEIYAAIDDEVIKPQIARSVKKRKADPQGKQFLDAGDGTIVYEDDRYFVVRPDTMESSCYFGKKTRWCIAQPPNSYFDQYTGEQKTFYFIKDEGMRDDDIFRKMAVQFGNESGIPIFEMFWDRFDDPYESYADNWEDAAEFLTEMAGIPLQIAEKIMEAIWEHAEQNPPKPNALIKLNTDINDNKYDTNYLSITSYLEEWPSPYANITYYVKVAVPIRKTAAINLLNNRHFVDWEGDKHDYIFDILLPRLVNIIEDGQYKDEFEYTDYKVGESFNVENSLLGDNFFKKLFDYSWIPVNYNGVEHTLSITFNSRKNLLNIEFSLDAETVYTNTTASNLEEAVTDVSDAFSNDIDLSVIENIFYTLMPEAITSTSSSLIDKLQNILDADSNIKDSLVSIEEVDVNEYYKNLILSTNFEFSIKRKDEEDEDYIHPNSKEFKQVIQNISEDTFNETWIASVNLSKRQLKLNLGDKYKEPELNVDMPNIITNAKIIKFANSPGDTLDLKVGVFSEINFIDTEQEILSVYNFYKFIRKNYIQIKRILQKEISIYSESFYSELGVPMQEAKKCWPGYEKKGTKKMFGKTVNNCVKKEEVEIVDEAEGKKDACYHKVKSRYKVWPSAYASGALVKCRKVGAKNWGNSKKESLRIIIEDEISQVLLEKKDDDNLEKAIMKALKDEGGAAGLDALEKHTDATEEEIKSIIKKSEKIQTHRDDDIIDMSGLEEIIKQETERYLTEKKKKAGTESSKESSLRDWFGRKGAKGSKKGWVDCNSPDGKGGYKACGRSSGEKRKKYPACRPTPGACKEKGKGKSWGKKAKKSK